LLELIVAHVETVIYSFKGTAFYQNYCKIPQRNNPATIFKCSAWILEYMDGMKASSYK
jgi:hypothetical protein